MGVSFFRKPIFLAAAIVLAAVILFGWMRADPIARVGAGYKAKIACSEIFLAGRDAEVIVEHEFDGIDPLLDLFPVNIDNDQKRVVVAGPVRLGRSVAIYRDGYGCTLIHNSKPTALPPAPARGSAVPLERSGDERLSGAVADILRDAFADETAGHRAVVVLKEGALVAEHYAQGFNADRPLLSWSMAKSVTATMIGAAAHQGLVDIDAPAPVREWRGEDERAAITWRDLLQMQSGLAFDEDYGSPGSDANIMLFASADMGGVAARKPLEHERGRHFNYSSGTSNLLSRTLKTQLEVQGADYYGFAAQSIFEPIGADSVVMEADASGVFVGSSFVYATAQDWARLGQLYLRNGVWNGTQVLPAGWAAFVAAPAAASDGQYGAHFWLNRDGESGRERVLPALPETAYYMSGHEGQFTLIVPSADLVIVRLGQTRGRRPLGAVSPMIEQIYEAATAR